MQIDKNSPKLMSLVWVLSVLFSFTARLPGLYDTSYQWRPIHTEMTAYWFVREGINLINYQTPLFGPPWQIPIEFPLFQATAAIIFNAGLGSFDFACRLTALLYFYIAALFLYLLCKKIFLGNQTSFMILSLYLWLPFNIHYSTEPLIDYLALALALAYFYFILLWLDTRSSIWKALLATICGSLAILVEPTTLPVVAIPIIVFVLKDILAIYRKDLKPPFDLRNLLNKVWTQRFYWLALIMMAVIPMVVGGIWTRHADLIKESSIFTQWHTSKAMVSWYFGNFYCCRYYYLPWRNSRDTLFHYFYNSKPWFCVSNIFESLSTTILFHFLLGLYGNPWRYGLKRFWELSQNKRRIFTFVFAIWAIIFLAFNAKDYNTLRNIATSENRKLEKSMARAQKVQKYVPLDEWVVVVEYDWDPSYVYPLQRKAMVITPRELGKPVCQVLADERFTLVAVADRSYDKNEELLNYAFQCFKSHKEVLPGAFVVTH